MLTLNNNSIAIPYFFDNNFKLFKVKMLSYYYGMNENYYLKKTFKKQKDSLQYFVEIYDIKEYLENPNKKKLIKIKEKIPTQTRHREHFLSEELSWFEFNDNIHFSTSLNDTIKVYNVKNKKLSCFGVKGSSYRTDLMKEIKNKTDESLLNSLYLNLLLDKNNNKIYRIYNVGKEDTTIQTEENYSILRKTKTRYMQVYDLNYNFIKEIYLGNEWLQFAGSEKGFLWFYKKDFELENIILYKVALDQFGL